MPSDNEQRDAQTNPDARMAEVSRLAEAPQKTVIQEMSDLIKHNKKWWLVPLITVLLGVGVIMMLGSTAAAPFIYTLF